ncbi:MAG TPA: lysophospholipid acyltransferase family protein [Bryobacteraceae bacterium]|jgi:1-acyl-sn-glycerol-3-phosphate acyltransferase|nr:lysophospholipid acyltransferase family protein [Bryobacteraceae bacterium]
MSPAYIRSLLITDPIIILATIIMGTISLLVSLFDSQGRVQHQISRVWSRMLLMVSGVRMEIEGLEKIDLQGAYVFVANHRSLMDTPVVLAHIPLQFRFLAKRGLFMIPILGTHLRRAGHLPVVKGDPRASLRSMSDAARIIRERGVSVLLFPEGGRSQDDTLLEFREGAAYIAIKAGVPVVPVALIGTRNVLKMGSMQIMSGVVKLRIGDPVDTSRLTLKDRSTLTHALREKVGELLMNESVSEPQKTR